MRTYIESYADYAIDDNPLRFFCYVVSDYRRTMAGQIKDVAEANNVAGSAITARDIIRLVRLDTKPTHAQFLGMFTSNKIVSALDFEG